MRGRAAAVTVNHTCRRRPHPRRNATGDPFFPRGEGGCAPSNIQHLTSNIQPTVCYDPRMLRAIGYRAAITSFVFTGLWFVLGLLLLSTPAPGALGIAGGMFTAWLLLFFAILALAGLTLLIAAINGVFPQNIRAPRRAELWGTSTPDAPAARRGGATRAPRASGPPHGG